MSIIDFFYGRSKKCPVPTPKVPIFRYGEEVAILPEGAENFFGTGIVKGIQEEFGGAWGYTYSLGTYYDVEYPDGTKHKIHASELRRIKIVDAKGNGDGT